jgi:carbon monoxide dehydrogenase subunit G
MIQFEGDRSFPQAPDFVAANLSNAAFLVGCLERVDQVIEASADRAVWKLKTGFSFLSTSLEVTLTVVERTSAKATFTAFSKGVGASSLVKAELHFSASETGTLVHYTAEVAERTGFLKIVSGGLIQAAAKSVIEDTWQAIEKKLQSQ